MQEIIYDSDDFSIVGGVFKKLKNTDLTDIVIPDGIEKIDESAFFKMDKLKSVKIPATVTSIGSKAFWGCTGISEIHIPENVTETGDRLFWGWEKEQIVHIANKKSLKKWDKEWKKFSHAKIVKN